MREEVLDILVYLYEELLSDDELNSMDALQKDLQAAGFLDKSIKQAFSWLDEIMQAGKETPQTSKEVLPTNTVRIFSTDEVRHFTTDAQGFMHLLEHNGLLDGQARELVIERALALQPKEKIDLEQLQWVVLFVLYHYPGKERQFESYEGLFFSEDAMTLH